MHHIDITFTRTKHKSYIHAYTIAFAFSFDLMQASNLAIQGVRSKDIKSLRFIKLESLPSVHPLQQRPLSTLKKLQGQESQLRQEKIKTQKSKTSKESQIKNQKQQEKIKDSRGKTRSKIRSMKM